MKKITLLIGLFLFVCAGVIGQTTADKNLPEFQIQQYEVESMLRFLASDELKGRRTGSEGNHIAARYLASHLEAYGFKPGAGDNGYFQKVPLAIAKPPASSQLKVDKTEYTFQKDYIILGGNAADLNTTAIFAGHGWVDEAENIDDYADLDVAGKVVFVLSGQPGANDRMAAFNAMPIKRKIAQEKGAVALIEIYNLNFPWNFFMRYFGGERIRIDNERPGEDQSLLYGWVKNIVKEDIFSQMKAGETFKISFSSSGGRKEEVRSNNVIGVLEGSDPELKDEYVLMTAHYDHVGVGKQGGRFTAEDSIFNGARDNAMGTIALLTAAKTLSQKRPKRSIIALAVTGEEIGLLGSSYYAENPLIPLDQTIFDLNTDGAGYNDTRYISVIGFGRTGTDEAINAAAAAAGLDVFPDPAPKQGLFDRSDNVSFAKKGIPAMNVSPGMTAFDDEINKYYHQVTDEAETVDMAYFLKYCQAFAHLARLIADDSDRPMWKEGDKYEEAGKGLYGNE